MTSNRFGTFKLIDPDFGLILEGGVIAEGIRFSTGAVALQMLVHGRAAGLYPSIAAMIGEQWLALLHPKREVVWDE